MNKDNKDTKLNSHESMIVSSLKSELDNWIDSCEKTAGNLRDIGHGKEAQNFDGQATAYWVVKTYLEAHGL